MKREYALPAAFSATVLAFVLLGMPGKHPSTANLAASPEPPVPMPRPPPDWIALEDNRAQDRGDGSSIARKNPESSMPRLADIPPVGPPRSPFVEPPLPPIEPGKNVKVISVEWTLEGPEGGRSGRAVIPWNLLDRVPHARLQMAPEYPRDLRARQIEGRAVVEFTVDEEGNVHHPVAVSATESAFAEAAVRAVAAWKFEPGTYHGRRVPFRMSVPVVFTLGSD